MAEPLDRTLQQIQKGKAAEPTKKREHTEGKINKKNWCALRHPGTRFMSACNTVERKTIKEPVDTKGKTSGHVAA